VRRVAQQRREVGVESRFVEAERGQQRRTLEERSRIVGVGFDGGFSCRERRLTERSSIWRGASRRPTPYAASS
jgi:hypothetical protein